MKPTDQHKDPQLSPDMQRDLLSIQEHDSHASASEPPAMMDQTILNMARRELDQRKLFSPRWMGAFATSAVLVVTLTLVIQQKQTLNEIPSATVPASQPAVTASESQSLTRQKSLKKSGELDAREKRLDADGVGEMVSSSTEPEFRSEPAPAKAPDSAPSAPVQATADSIQVFSDTSMAISDPAEESPEPKADMAESESEDALSPPVTQVGRAQSNDEQKETLTLTPDQWLKRLNELKGNQQTDQFLRELDEFRKTYPDYPLPPVWEE